MIFALLLPCHTARRINRNPSLPWTAPIIEWDGEAIHPAVAIIPVTAVSIPVTVSHFISRDRFFHNSLSQLRHWKWSCRCHNTNIRYMTPITIWHHIHPTLLPDNISSCIPDTSIITVINNRPLSHIFRRFFFPLFFDAKFEEYAGLAPIGYFVDRYVSPISWHNAKLRKTTEFS